FCVIASSASIRLLTCGFVCRSGLGGASSARHGLRHRVTQMTQDDAETAVCVMAVVAGQVPFFGLHDADDAASSLLGQKRGCLLWCGAPYSVKKEPLRGATLGRRSAEQQEEHACPVVLFLLVPASVLSPVR